MSDSQLTPDPADVSVTADANATINPLAHHHLPVSVVPPPEKSGNTPGTEGGTEG